MGSNVIGQRVQAVRTSSKGMLVFTYDRDAAQRCDERGGGEAVGGKVTQLPQAHQTDPQPPQHTLIVRLTGATLGLTNMGVFLSTQTQDKHDQTILQILQACMGALTAHPVTSDGTDSV